MKIPKFLKLIIPVFFTFFVIGFFYVSKISAVKLYPVLMNFLFFCIFFGSLMGKETVIQKIAKTLDGKLEEPVKTYTKNLTYVWIVFLFFNFLMSVWSLFLPDKFWALYNGFISYLLIGGVFAVELPIRYFFKKRHNV